MRNMPLLGTVVGGFILVILLVGGISYVGYVQIAERFEDKPVNVFPLIKVTGNHDGLSIMTDKLTGCDYIVTPNSVTPRMYSDGVQVCKTLTIAELVP